jgi:hypothetical protein
LPTILKIGNLRFFFFSREETRMHIHINSPEGEAKFWLEPQIELALNKKFSEQKLNEIEKIIVEYENEFKSKWTEYFRS